MPGTGRPCGSSWPRCHRAAHALAEALTALTTELARIGSAAPLAWPSQDQQNDDRTDHSDGR
jgi:hypothetical protein